MLEYFEILVIYRRPANITIGETRVTVFKRFVEIKVPLDVHYPFLEQVRFEQMFSFKYSPRPNTEALSWEDDVLESEKTRRLMILQRLQKGIQLEIHRDMYLKREFEILVGSSSKEIHLRRQIDF